VSDTETVLPPAARAVSARAPFTHHGHERLGSCRSRGMGKRARISATAVHAASPASARRSSSGSRDRRQRLVSRRAVLFFGWAPVRAAAGPPLIPQQARASPERKRSEGQKTRPNEMRELPSRRETRAHDHAMRGAGVLPGMVASWRHGSPRRVPAVPRHHRRQQGQASLRHPARRPGIHGVPRTIHRDVHRPARVVRWGRSSNRSATRSSSSSQPSLVQSPLGERKPHV